MKNYKLTSFCEFDKYATKAYCAIHNESEDKNLGDITKVDATKLEPFTMIVGGSPCQDFSVAGKQKGSVWTCKDCNNDDGTPFEWNPLTVHYTERHKCPHCGSENIDKSRSSLLVEWLRIIRANKPKFGIYENVKNIVGKEFRETTFKLFEQELQEYGYNTYWKVLNAKEYGIPQNRERVYLILIQKELDNGKFKYPEGFDNGVRLKDILEDEVDEKYYISDDKVEKILNSDFMQEKLRIQFGDTCSYLLARDYKDPKCVPVRIGNIYGEQFGTGYAGNVWDKDAICPTLMTMQGGNRQPMVLDETEKVGIDKSFNNPKTIDNANCITAREDRGVSNRKSEGTAVLEKVVCEQRCDEGIRFFKDEVCGTLRTIDAYGDKRVLEKLNMLYRIRKLTPKECFRLMGFSDEDFERAEAAGISNSQLYKLAGNSIVTDVLYNILIELYNVMPYLFDDLTLSSYFSGIGAFEIALNRLYKYINTGVKDTNFIQPLAV